MKRNYLLYCIIISFLLFVSCTLSPIHRNWTGTCLITVLNGSTSASYQGIVESFSFTEDGFCSLMIRDGFLGGSTLKSYAGYYEYDEEDYLLEYSLTLEEIDSIPVSSNIEYDLDGSDIFNLENETGSTTAEISGGDIPASVEIDIAFTLTAE
jgi:hypothetical protein